MGKSYPCPGRNSSPFCHGSPAWQPFGPPTIEIAIEVPPTNTPAHALRTNSVPGTLHGLFLLIFTASLRKRHHYHTYFTNEDVEDQ